MTDPTIRAALEQQAKLLSGCAWSCHNNPGRNICSHCLQILQALEDAYQLGQQTERERCALLVAGHITDSCPKDCAACELARDMARQIINTSLSNMTDAAWVAALRTPEEPT